MKTKTLKAILILAVALCLLSPVSLRALTLTFDLNYEFSGGASPSGNPPWIRLTFEDIEGEDIEGGVKLRITSMLQSETEFVGSGGVLFNFNPYFDPTGLVFTYIGGLEPIEINKKVNNFRADGDGYFDIQFIWNISNNADRFGVGDYVEYFITGIPGLSASYFNFSSTSGGGQGDYHAAAHIQGIPETNGKNSGWIGDKVTVPEPGILILLGIGLTAVGIGSRWMRRK